MAIIMATSIHSITVKVLIIDLKLRENVLERQLTLPFTASFKTYYSEPYLGILFGRAKLLLLNIRHALL